MVEADHGGGRGVAFSYLGAYVPLSEVIWDDTGSDLALLCGFGNQGPGVNRRQGVTCLVRHASLERIDRTRVNTIAQLALKNVR